jgi:histone deacetylase 1/2
LKKNEFFGNNPELGYDTGHDIVVLLLYVDDIIITGSASGVIQHVISALTSKFDLIDLGSLHYFLGIQIT